MKNSLSLIVCGLTVLVLLQFRISNSGIKSDKPLKITTWDAFGYYAYLPSVFMYNDFKKLDWLHDIDRKYEVTGGDGWQAVKLDGGSYTFKYLGGVAIMQLPLFFIGHIIALSSEHPADGFSPPYQYALGFGIIIYCLLAILLLRKILLLYFTDLAVALTLLLVCLATNFVQYAAVDNAQSHAYIFPLYVLIIYSTIKWHQKPRVLWAALTGFIIGLATICRPTEAIMLFIPLLWNTHTKEAAREKWQTVKQNKFHVLCAVVFGFIGVLPQLVYWKITTGSFIYDVGSKWDFLNPHFRVLFGWEKGWFIYTPVTILFIIGLLFIKRFPFKKSVLWFCLLNIWIIIAWSDWRYGGSYSARALMQSLPVFALPLGAFIERINFLKWRPAFYIAAAYLVFVNLFQTWQYNQTILHFNDMNRLYYSRIYLDPSPSPLDMSLLDTDEILDERGYSKKLLHVSDSAFHVSFSAGTEEPVFEAHLDNHAADAWLKIEANIKAPWSLWQSYLNAEVKSADSGKRSRVRLFSPISKNETTNEYAFYMQVPGYFRQARLKIFLSSYSDFDGSVEKITITQLEK